MVSQIGHEYRFEDEVNPSARNIELLMGTNLFEKSPKPIYGISFVTSEAKTMHRVRTLRYQNVNHIRDHCTCINLQMKVELN